MANSIPTDTAALHATVLAKAAPSSDHGVVVLPLEYTQPLWLAYTTGSTVAGQPHTVTLYARDGAGWRMLANHELPDALTVAEGDVAQVLFGDQHAWIAVRSSSGLVGPCCLDVVRYDGSTLRQVFTFSERGVQNIRYRTSPSGNPQIEIDVLPPSGAESKAGTLQTRVFVWDGLAFAQR